MPWLSSVLLVLFVACALIYARATRELVRLDRLRLETEPPKLPDDMLGAATRFARQMGITLAPGGDELKSFCERHGHGDAYKRANRRLYGAILVALCCAYFAIRFGSGKALVP